MQKSLFNSPLTLLSISINIDNKEKELQICNRSAALLNLK